VPCLRRLRLSSALGSGIGMTCSRTIRLVVLLLMLVGTAGCDQATKHIARSQLSGRGSLTLSGAFLLVGVCMPVLNPGLTRMATHRDPPSVGYYIAVTPIPVSILAASWLLNKKARAIRHGGEEPPRVPESTLERRLKWILAAVVIVLVAIAFLW